MLVAPSLSCNGPVDNGGDDSGTMVKNTDSGYAGDDGGVADAGIRPVPGCPTAPPFDLASPQLQKCFEPVLVAIGDRSRRIVSFDAVNWLGDTIDDGNVVNGQALDDGAAQAAFGKGYIVTASDFGIFTSADRGLTWTKAPPPAAQQWGQGVHVSPVLFNGTLFIVFSDTTSFTSEDAYTWVKHSLSDLAGSHLAFYGRAVGKDGRIVSNGGGSEVNVSDDGVTWRKVDTTLTGGMPSMAYGNGVFVAVGKRARIYSTDNGETWHKVVDDCSGNDPVKCIGDYPSKMLFHDGVFTFTNGAGQSSILQSTDGQTWVKIGDGFGFDWQHEFFKGVDYAAQSGNTYRKGASAGGDWSSMSFSTSHSGYGIGSFSTGLVLKR